MRIHFATSITLCTLSFICVFEKLEAKDNNSAGLIIKSKDPIYIVFEEKGRQRPVRIPKEIEESITEIYSNISTIDLDGDEFPEVVATMEPGNVNVCSKIYEYNKTTDSLIEIHFSGGGMCNFRKESGFLVSSYRNGAAWEEDFYKIKKGIASLYYKDSCIGCGEISRIDYKNSKSATQYLVTDGKNFKDRLPISINISSSKAVIYADPAPLKPTKMYLVKGDKASVLEFGKFKGQDFAKFRFQGKVITEGWVKCDDAFQCK